MEEKLGLTYIESILVEKWENDRTPEDGPPDGDPVGFTSYYLNGVEVVDEESINKVIAAVKLANPKGE